MYEPILIEDKDLIVGRVIDAINLPIMFNNINIRRSNIDEYIKKDILLTIENTEFTSNDYILRCDFESYSKNELVLENEFYHVYAESIDDSDSYNYGSGAGDRDHWFLDKIHSQNNVYIFIKRDKNSNIANMYITDFGLRENKYGYLLKDNRIYLQIKYKYEYTHMGVLVLKDAYNGFNKIYIDITEYPDIVNNVSKEIKELQVNKNEI